MALLRAFLDAFIGPRPINSGGQPTTAVDLIRAKIFKLFFFAYSSSQTITADAPSVNGDAVPAVTVPFSSKASFNPSKISCEVLGRIPPSLLIFSSLFVIETISLSNKFDSLAKLALEWLLIAKSCCSFREILNFFATFSAVIPIDIYTFGLSLFN